MSGTRGGLPGAQRRDSVAHLRELTAGDRGVSDLANGLGPAKPDLNDLLEQYLKGTN